jgi:FKBP-type peptidyl-prolyl cis-trans isomerase
MRASRVAGCTSFAAMKRLAIHLVTVLGATLAFACEGGAPPPATPVQAVSLPSPADAGAPSASEATDAGAVALAAPGASPTAAPVDVASPSAGAQPTGSGLVTKVLHPGAGTAHPGASDRVKVHYSGWTTDGALFDSSVQRGEPVTFGVSQVIPGWTEALQLMVVGEKRRLWIPANLAYGSRARPGIPANSALTFDVELLDVTVAPKPPPTPADVAAPPPDAKKTPSGLAYRLLHAGTDPAAKRPARTSLVTVHYTGWTTDGKMFDSSIPDGSPAQFPLDRVIPGWTEGLQLMKVGDSMRFWIPGKLAYDDPTKPAREGTPHGVLVFDVELLEVK